MLLDPDLQSQYGSGSKTVKSMGIHAAPDPQHCLQLICVEPSRKGRLRARRSAVFCVILAIIECMFGSTDWISANPDSDEDKIIRKLANNYWTSGSATIWRSKRKRIWIKMKTKKLDLAKSGSEFRWRKKKHRKLSNNYWTSGSATVSNDTKSGSEFRWRKKNSRNCRTIIGPPDPLQCQTAEIECGSRLKWIVISTDEYKLVDEGWPERGCDDREARRICNPRTRYPQRRSSGGHLTPNRP